MGLYEIIIPNFHTKSKLFERKNYQEIRLIMKRANKNWERKFFKLWKVINLKEKENTKEHQLHRHYKNRITDQKAVKGKDQKESNKEKSGHKCKDIIATIFHQNSNCKQVTPLLLISATIY